MTSLILRTAALLLFPLLLLYSLFLMLGGHHAPGGGFVGGLVATSGISLYGLSCGIPAARRLLRVDPRALSGTGLALALGSGLPALLAGEPVFKGIWMRIPGTNGLVVGTPLLFDIGVYLLVVGVAAEIIMTLARRE